MDFSLISNTFITIFTTDVFFYCILGVVASMVIGTLPGLSATMGIAILTPSPSGWNPRRAWLCCWASITPPFGPAASPPSLSTRPAPPPPSLRPSTATTWSLRGKVKKALNMNTIYSVIGGLIGTVVLIVFFLPRGGVCPEVRPLRCSPWPVRTVHDDRCLGGSVFKGLLAGALGLLVSTIGMDPMTGALRFTFGNINMLSGIEFV